MHWLSAIGLLCVLFVLHMVWKTLRAMTAQWARIEKRASERMEFAHHALHIPTAALGETDGWATVWQHAAVCVHDTYEFNMVCRFSAFVKEELGRSGVPFELITRYTDQLASLQPSTYPNGALITGKAPRQRAPSIVGAAAYVIMSIRVPKDTEERSRTMVDAGIRRARESHMLQGEAIQRASAASMPPPPTAKIIG